jgi:threonine/homoserine/homoserine lactone efflux protein
MLVMALSPGPAVILSLKTGFSGSKLSVFLCALGLNMGTLIWFCAVSLGLGALFLKLPALILIMAVLGGLYLIYIGFNGILSALSFEGSVILVYDQGPQSMAHKGLKIMAQGFRVQLLNPKALLFFTAVLPPFLDPDRLLGPQFIIYGITTLTMDTVAFVGYGLMARAVSEKFQNQLFQKNFTLITSALLGLMGMILIVKTLQMI